MPNPLTPTVPESVSKSLAEGIPKQGDSPPEDSQEDAQAGINHREQTVVPPNLPIVDEFDPT